MAEPSQKTAFSTSALVDAVAGGAERAREAAGVVVGQARGKAGRSVQMMEDWSAASGWLGGGGCNLVTGCSWGVDWGLLDCVRDSSTDDGRPVWARNVAHVHLFL